MAETWLMGRTALVTGGARRVGRDTCLALGRAGCHVIVHHRTSDKEAASLVEELRALGVEAWSIAADLAKPGQAEDLIGRASRQTKRAIDILVNNASVFPEQRIEDAAYDDVDAMMRLHAWAPFTMTRALARQTQDGAVVNVLDTRVAKDAPDHFAYHLSKQALTNLTSTLAKAFAPALRVTGLAPGAVLPPAGKDAAHMEMVRRATPLQRLGTPSDVTDAIVYLLNARYVTGHVLFVDGGLHLP